MLCNVSARLKNAQTTIETYISYRENRLVMPPRLAEISFFILHKQEHYSL